jgi:hypothetical protein
MSESIRNAIDQTEIYYEANIPTYWHGPPGVGKSQGFRQLATRLGEKHKRKYGFKDIRLSNRLPEDISGIPVPDLQQRMAVWLKAEFWPSKERDGEYGILLFDELSDAPKGLQSCAYQIILDRKINDFELPAGWWPCAAGNRREDRAAAQTLSTALASRFAHIEIIPDPKAWVEWANKNGVDPLITGFINFRPELLHKMEGSDMLRFPTARTWVSVSKVVAVAPGNMRHALVENLVGAGPASEFKAYMDALDLPSIDEVVEDPKRCHIPTKPSSKYAMSSMLSRYANRKNLGAIVTYIGRKGFGRDFEAVCMLDAVHRDQALCDTNAWLEWANRNKDVHV